MSYPTALAVIAVAQGAFMVLTLILLAVNRARRHVRGRGERLAEGELTGAVQRWQLGAGSVTDVAVALRQMPPEIALEQASLLVAARVPATQRGELATALRRERWVATVLARATSRFWWRRLQAARLLSVVCGSADRELLRRLLADPHPAVLITATTALAAAGDEALVALTVDRLPDHPLVVRLFQFGALREVWPQATRALDERLRPDAAPARLEIWINLAEALGTPEVVARAATLSGHADATVRLAVARALKKYFHPDAERSLRRLLADPDWRVRGQAARGLGAIGAMAAIPDLSAALADPVWWVRFRAGLALAQLGEAGRRALRRARTMPDRYGSEMAQMVSGLSEGGVVELAEG